MAIENALGEVDSRKDFLKRHDLYMIDRKCPGDILDDPEVEFVETLKRVTLGM